MSVVCSPSHGLMLLRRHIKVRECPRLELFQVWLDVWTSSKPEGAIPNLSEIRAVPLLGQISQNRQDLDVRVIMMNLWVMMSLVTDEKMFHNIATYACMYVYQISESGAFPKGISFSSLTKPQNNAKSIQKCRWFSVLWNSICNGPKNS